MMRVVGARIRQGHRTTRYPKAPAPSLPERFRGMPLVDPEKCAAAGVCDRCAASCPVAAIEVAKPTSTTKDTAGRVRVDLGRCLFCTDCSGACPAGALKMGGDFRLATRTRDALVVEPRADALHLAEELSAELRRLFGRSLRFREVSAGGCNACEADSNVLTTVGWDIGRFGIQFVASPRHADGLWVTGPVSRNMRLGLEKTWQALPKPRIVVAVGACAISGGPFRDHPEVCNGVAELLPVDLFVPGCPPHPLTILDGLLRLLGKVR